MEKCFRLLYKGRVQGVGFRYTVVDVALKNGLKGYVKNLPNGDVEAVAIGAEDKIESFIQEINSTMERYIHSFSANPSVVGCKYNSFRIEY